MKIVMVEWLPISITLDARRKWLGFHQKHRWKKPHENVVRWEKQKNCLSNGNWQIGIAGLTLLADIVKITSLPFIRASWPSRVLPQSRTVEADWVTANGRVSCLRSLFDHQWNVLFCTARSLAPFWGCFDEPLLCLRAIFLPGGLFGRNAQKIDGSSCPGMCAAYCALRYVGLPCILHMEKRRTLRMKYGLKPEPCGDFLTTAFCAECALVQEKRELDMRGLSFLTCSIAQNDGFTLL